MNDFFETGAGRKFSSNVDSLARGFSNLSSVMRTLEKIAKELHEANRLKKIELGIGQNPSDVAREFVKDEDSGSEDDCLFPSFRQE